MPRNWWKEQQEKNKDHGKDAAVRQRRDNVAAHLKNMYVNAFIECPGDSVIRMVATTESQVKYYGDAMLNTGCKELRITQSSTYYAVTGVVY